MLSHLLILAQAAGPAADAAAHGEAASGITKITQEFGLSWPFLLAQILNFSVVAFLLWRFAFKPVLSMLDERQQKIAAGLKYAEEMKAKLDAVQQESVASSRRAQLEATRIIDELPAGAARGDEDHRRGAQVGEGIPRQADAGGRRQGRRDPREGPAGHRA